MTNVYSSNPHPRLVYAWEGEVKDLRTENSRMRIALETIMAADQSEGGDGPMAAIARTALIGR